jgi:DNA-binding transcriptional MerR regulator
MALEDMIAEYSDPNRFKRQDKGMALGGILAVLASAATKQNLAPRYLSGVERMQEQQQQQRMMERMQMMDMMQVQQHQERMRQAERDEILFKRQADMWERQKKADAAFAKDVSEDYRKQESADLKLETDRMKGIADFVGKMSDIAMKIPSTGVQAAGVAGKVGEKVTKGVAKKKEEVGKAKIEKEVGRMEDVLEVYPERAEWYGAEKRLGPRALEAERRATVGWEQQKIINDQIIESNKKKAIMGDEGGQAFMDLMDNGKFTKAYSPEAQQTAIEDYQNYRKGEAAIADQRRRTDAYIQSLDDKRDGAGDTGNLLARWNEIGTTQQGRIIDTIALYAQESPAGIGIMIARARKAGKEADISDKTVNEGIRDALDTGMTIASAGLQIGEQEARTIAKSYIPNADDYGDYSPEVNEVLAQLDKSGELRKVTEGIYKRRNAFIDGYQKLSTLEERNTWIDKLGIAAMGVATAVTPTPTKPTKIPTTPVGKALASKREEEKIKKADVAGRKFSKKAEKESNDMIRTLRNQGFSLREIKDQLSTHEGREELKGFFVADEKTGELYDATTLNLILFNMDEEIDKLIEREQLALSPGVHP